MSNSDKNEFYEADLAYIHDAGFGGFARGVAPGLIETLEKGGLTKGKIVDLGCGSGILLQQLAKKGYELVGVDRSAAMIELARERVPEAELHVEPIKEFKLPNCAAVTALGEVVCYLASKENGTRGLAQLALRAFKALPSGGLFVFDVAELGLDRERPPTFIKSEDWACLVRFEYDHAHDRLSRHITTFRQVGKSYRRGSETHVLQLFDGKAVAAMLRDAGFKVRTFRKLGKYSLLKGRVGFIARKP